MAENNGSADSELDSDQGQDISQNYSHILQSLINSGQVHIMPNFYVDNYSGLSLPKINSKPNTSTLDSSEFSIMTRQTSGLMGTKRKLASKEKNVAKMLVDREKGLYTNSSFSRGNKCRISNRYLPNDITILDSCTGKIFCGNFSKDGNRFITASQDRSIRLYDSSDGSYKFLNSLRARDVGWSILDVAFSPNREHFVYSTWSSACPPLDHTEKRLDSYIRPAGLVKTLRTLTQATGNEELIPAHEYDVNSVVFADDSSHIIYSGGDDGLIKVWDRRTLVESSAKPVGILAGHIDGVTFIDSKGDGRHLISNSKDQSIKLWDVRVFSGDKVAQKTLKAVQEQTWDYRWQEVPKKLYTMKSKLEGDTSIMTYRGHVVIKTLVRCRFSPLETTGQRYIYTGCGIGRVVIYDSLTGKIETNINGHLACVRDVDWHPTRNEILSSSWDGNVLKWSYVDEADLDL